MSAMHQQFNFSNEKGGTTRQFLNQSHAQVDCEFQMDMVIGSVQHKVCPFDRDNQNKPRTTWI